MDFRNRTITAPWIWLNGQFCANAKIRVDQEGRIAAVSVGEGDGKHRVEEEEETSDLVSLHNLALLPSFVNAHSHAFHRFLRGRSQIGRMDGDNFWKWRKNMYKLVENVDFEQMKKMCASTFREMLSAGITTVGEFHYVHHADGNDGRYGLDLSVAEAAREVGIRLVLIETLYMRAGFGRDGVEPEQWRFASETVDEFLRHVEELRSEIGKENYNGLVTFALAVHSLRAVPVPEARRLFQFARQHGLCLHIHLEEQPTELEDCRRTHGGRSPVEVLLQDVVDDASEQSLDFLTAVHCTHTQRPLLDRLARAGANICICPCTEGYLGDGVPELDANDQLCLGTDCNNRIAMLEEMRWVAFCQNMRANSRNCAGLSAPKLLELATKNGAKSLGLDHAIGDFAVGKYMDFLAIDLQSPRLVQFVDSSAAEDGQSLLDAIVFGAGNAEVVMSGVAGRARFGRKGVVPKHQQQPEIDFQ